MLLSVTVNQSPVTDRMTTASPTPPEDTTWGRGLPWHSLLCISSVQLLSRVRLFATPWIAAHQASLSITNSQSSLRLRSMESVMPSSHLTLCRPLLLLPPISPSIRVFSNESTLRMRWPMYWSFSFSISPSKEIPGLISFFVSEPYWNTDTAISTQSKSLSPSVIFRTWGFLPLTPYLPSPMHCVFPALRPSLSHQTYFPTGNAVISLFLFLPQRGPYQSPSPLGKGIALLLSRPVSTWMLWAAFRDLIASLNTLPPLPSTPQIKLPTSASCLLIWKGKKICPLCPTFAFLLPL